MTEAINRWQVFARRYELPTFALAFAVYAAWLALTWHHALFPGWLLFMLGGYVTQLHFSLQHESIHALRNVPRWLRTALVWPPLGLWFPYPLYNRSHSTHHVNFNITHPTRDTESFYHLRERWPEYGPLTRVAYWINQTLIARLLLGPFLRLWKLGRREVARAASGDLSNLGHWAAHAVGVTVLLYWVMAICGMRFWEYLLYFAYPGMMLGMLRIFTEHRYGEKPQERIAIVESNWVFGLLFLYNNLHLVHHRWPTLAWYEIPRRFREQRAALLAANGNFYYRGYAEIARRFLFAPVFAPVHPKW
jgi:fatty acid desaturase